MKREKNPKQEIKTYSQTAQVLLFNQGKCGDNVALNFSITGNFAGHRKRVLERKSASRVVATSKKGLS